MKADVVEKMQSLVHAVHAQGSAASIVVGNDILAAILLVPTAHKHALPFSREFDTVTRTLFTSCATDQEGWSGERREMKLHFSLSPPRKLSALADLKWYLIL